MIEWLRLERISKITQFQPSTMGQAATYQVRLPRAPSHLALSACRDGKEAVPPGVCAAFMGFCTI